MVMVSAHRWFYGDIQEVASTGETQGDNQVRQPTTTLAS